MAKKKQGEVKQGLDEWMSTYSDMVTLLLCFFVLLYAASTPDETKWQYIYQAFNTSGTYINPFVAEEEENALKETDNEDGNSETPPGSSGDTSSTNNPTNGIENFEDLYSWLQTTVDQNNLEGEISVEGTSTRIYIRFDSSIMFEGDSAVLLESGRNALKLMFPGIRFMNDYIKTMMVTGHTAEGISNVNDWDLSASRACSVVKYMDFNKVVDSDKFIAEGRAQYDPIGDNTTEEGKAKNRRVELVLIRNDVEIKNTDVLQDILKYDYQVNQTITDPNKPQTPDGSVDQSIIDQIIENINDKYNTDSDSTPQTNPDSYTGPSDFTDIFEIPDSDLLEVDKDGNVITEAPKDESSPTEQSADVTASE